MAIETPKGQNRPMELLSLEEYERVKISFLEIFDWYIKSIVSDGDQEEMSTHIATYYTTFRLYQITIPSIVEDVNMKIFTNVLLRDFYLELLDRFTLELIPLGNNAFARLINTLAVATSECKARPPKNKELVNPVLVSIGRSSEDASLVYLENPWLVVIVLLNTQFMRTSVGQTVGDAIRKGIKDDKTS